MDKKLFKSLIWLITYAVCLVLFVTKFDEVRLFVGDFFSLFSPLILGFALAFILDRPCQFFHRTYGKAIKKQALAPLALGLAVGTSYLLLLAIIVAIIAFVVPQFVESIELFSSSLDGYIANAQVFINGFLRNLRLETLDLSGLNNILEQILDGALSMATDAMPHLLSVTSAIISTTVTFVLALVFSIYMLAGRDTLLRQCGHLFRAYLPKKLIDPLADVLNLTASTFTRFISGQITEAFILGTLCGIGMLFIYADYAALVGVIIGCTALVPVVGAYVGTVLCALLLVMVSPVATLAFIIFLLILQQIEGNIIYPRVVGTSIGLPGIWVLTAVTIGAGTGGILGVLLSVPVASILYTLLRRDIRRRLSKEG